MEKAKKKKKGILDQEITITIDERLSNTPPSKGALEKTQRANERLRRMKSLPKVD